MSVAPNAGIIDFGTFTPPSGGQDGIQGQVPAPLSGQAGYVLTGNGWSSLGALGVISYQGTWNAATNNPTITSGVGTQGYYYVVSVAGTTNIDGISSWGVGDWIIFNGSVWQKIDSGSTVDITGGQINNTLIGNITPSTGTFTTVGIDAPTTDATFTNDTGITGWVYSGKSVSVSAQETNPTGLFFKPDGTKMYVTGTTGDDVNEYTLGTAWDVSTATFIAVSTGITQDGSPIDLFFKDDGLTLFVLGQANDTVYQYTLSVAWDITTATYASKSFSVTTQEATPQGLWFRPNGTTMYVIGNTNDTVYQYTLSTPWDISTASYANISFSVASQEANPTQVVLSADGTKMWVLGSTGDDINEYTLGTAWNVSTASFVNNVYVGFQEVNPNGLFIDSTAANRVYICGTGNDTVYQYNTATNTVDAMTDRLFVSGEGYIDGNTFFGSNVVVDGTFGVQGSSAFSTTTVNGTLTASAAVNFSTTTSNISVGTAQTTGLLTLGGTTQTGILTVGQSTGAQTLNIGTGATTNATTKTINIGTAGVSGSTTTINIGSAVSGALGNISMGNSGTQFLVAPTTSAVNYVQVTGAATTGAPVISMQGSDTNIGLRIRSKGTGTIAFTSDGGAFGAYVNPVSGAANHFELRSAAASSGPVLASQGTDTNIDLNLTTKGTGAIRFNTGGGEGFRVQDFPSSNTFVTATGQNNSSPGLFSAGTPTNIGFNFSSKGTGGLGFLTNGFAQVQFSVVHTASAVNYLQATGAAAGGSPYFITAGSDTNINFTVASKGSGTFAVTTNGGAQLQFNVSHTASAVNYVQVTGGATGVQPIISSQGSDSNIALTLRSKGTFACELGSSAGTVLFQAVPVASSVNFLRASPAAAGSGPGLSAQGSDTNIDLNLTTKGTGAVNLNTGNGTAFKVFDNFDGGTIANSIGVYPRGTTFSPFFFATGSATDIGISLVAKAAGNLRFLTGANNAGVSGVDQMRVTHTASAVNYVQVTGAATGSIPSVSAQGSDTNIALYLTSKGSGAIRLSTNQQSNTQLRITHTANSVNFVDITGGAANAAVTVAASTASSDTNVDLALTPKGTGYVQFGTHTATALTISGYIEIKDAGGTIRKLAVVT